MLEILELIILLAIIILCILHTIFVCTAYKVEKPKPLWIAKTVCNITIIFAWFIVAIINIVTKDTLWLIILDILNILIWISNAISDFKRIKRLS